MKAPKKLMHQICREWNRVGTAVYAPLTGIECCGTVCLSGDSPVHGVSVSTRDDIWKGIVLRMEGESGQEPLFKEACVFVMDILARNGYCHMEKWCDNESGLMPLEFTASGRQPDGSFVFMEAMDVDSIPDGIELYTDAAEVADIIDAALAGDSGRQPNGNFVLQGRCAAFVRDGMSAAFAEDQGMLHVDNGTAGIAAVKALFKDSTRYRLNLPMLELTGYVCISGDLRKEDARTLKKS